MATSMYMEEILTLFHMSVNRIVTHNTFELDTLKGCIAYAKYQTDWCKQIGSRKTISLRSRDVLR